MLISSGIYPGRCCLTPCALQDLCGASGASRRGQREESGELGPEEHEVGGSEQRRESSSHPEAANSSHSGKETQKLRGRHERAGISSPSKKCIYK